MAQVLPFRTVVESIRAKIRAFKESGVGQFVQKIQDDDAPNLAALLAWGTLSTLLPLLLGILGVSGLILRDPRRLDQVYNTLLVALPKDALGPLQTTLESVRQGAAGSAGIVGLALLLYNGSRFFGNMGAIFNRAYHVENRNFLMHNAVAILMLILATLLLVLSTVALGLGTAIGSLSENALAALPFDLLDHGTLAQWIGWAVSLASAILLFVLLYRLLPNAGQGFREVVPGAIASTVLFFTVVMIFPIYVALFPPSQAYAAFGLFLVFTFWLYLLGWVFVIGAELNAFLAQPAHSVALAEATERARHGKAEIRQQGGWVEAQAQADAPERQGGLSKPATDQAPQAQARPASPGPRPQSSAAAPSMASSITGKLLGFVGLVAAAILLRNRSVPEHPHAR